MPFLQLAKMKMRNGQAPAWMLLCIGTMVALLALGFHYVPLRAEPRSSASVTVEKSGVYALREIAALVRRQTGFELYVDRRDAGRRVFISSGKYEHTSLIESLHTATGMESRKIDKVVFLARRNSTYGSRVAFPVMPKSILNRFEKSLRPIGERANLQKEGIPWDSSAFLKGTLTPFKALTKKQQEFVNKSFPLFTSNGNSDSSSPDAVGLERDIQNARVRLGTSFLMAFQFYTPAASETEEDSVAYFKLFQIYYDYRDRLGVQLLDD